MSPDRLTYQVGKEGKNTEYRMLFVFLKSLQKILPLLLLLDTFHIRCNVLKTLIVSGAGPSKQGPDIVTYWAVLDS